MHGRTIFKIELLLLILSYLAFLDVSMYLVSKAQVVIYKLVKVRLSKEFFQIGHDKCLQRPLFFECQFFRWNRNDRLYQDLNYLVIIKNRHSIKFASARIFHWHFGNFFRKIHFRWNMSSNLNVGAYVQIQERQFGHISVGYLIRGCPVLFFKSTRK